MNTYNRMLFSSISNSISITSEMDLIQCRTASLLVMNTVITQAQCAAHGVKQQCD